LFLAPEKLLYLLISSSKPLAFTSYIRKIILEYIFKICVLLNSLSVSVCPSIAFFLLLLPFLHDAPLVSRHKRYCLEFWIRSLGVEGLSLDLDPLLEKYILSSITRVFIIRFGHVRAFWKLKLAHWSTPLSGRNPKFST
jgi:hypothetical protein